MTHHYAREKCWYRISEMFRPSGQTIQGILFLVMTVFLPVCLWFCLHICLPMLKIVFNLSMQGSLFIFGMHSFLGGSSTLNWNQYWPPDNLDLDPVTLDAPNGVSHTHHVVFTGATTGGFRRGPAGVAGHTGWHVLQTYLYRNLI